MDDVLVLARAQFGLNIGFHILFPSLTIALGWILLYFRVQYARSGDAAWLATYKLWTKVFALSFAMGVVSGITMSFQFGTNWPGFMQKVGNIAGPLLAYEVLTAFFLEATFLGVMLFGMNRVPGWMHIFSAAMVAIGTTLSAFWILALNSWMQTPSGQGVDAVQIIAGDWWSVIFNPSFPYRFTHMLLASGLTAAFVVAGLSAWRLLRAGEDVSARKTLRTGLVLAAVLAPFQIAAGDLHGGQDETGAQGLSRRYVLACPEQSPRRKPGDDERGGEARGEQHVSEPVRERRVEYHAPPVPGDDLEGVDPLPRGRLHPRVEREDPEGRNGRADRHHCGGEDMHPARDAVHAEEHHPEESRLEEERRQHLVGKQGPRDVADLLHESRPVGAELERHGDAAHHAHREGEREHLGPELVGGEPRRVAGARVLHAKVKKDPPERDGEAREQDMEPDVQPELGAGENEDVIHG